MTKHGLKISVLCLFCISCFGIWIYLYAEEKKEQPIIINADHLEYSTDDKQVTASGDVEVDYKGSKLTCRKLTVNTQTKDGQAEGDARLENKGIIIEGSQMDYNFQNKAGIIRDAIFRSNPYFGRTKRMEKISDAEFIGINGYATTCSLDIPHYRMKSKTVNIYPGEKIQINKATFCVGDLPLLYLPKYARSLKDPLMHVQMMPGTSKDWGQYMLTAWRYNLTENVTGRIFLDYRSYLGVAEGLGTNYTSDYGKGDFKFYYTQERDKSKDVSQEDVMVPKVFQRYFIRWRHKWDIDKNTNLTAEYYKINDSKKMVLDPKFDFLKDYFFREYEKDTQPPSYISLHHSFTYSSLDLVMRKRTNRWYSSGYLEQLPQVNYNMASIRILETPFYFDSSSAIANLNKKNTSTMTPAANDTSPDAHVNRLDTTNKFSAPLKILFIQISPFVGSRETFYDQKINGSPIAIRTIFLTGAEMSTKFYRIFNINSNFLGLNFNGLRHIITPTISYNYNRVPTIHSSKLTQIDGVDSVDATSNSAALELSNKLQTKRNGQSVDLVDFRVNSSYVFKPKSGDKRGSNLSDILYYIRILPYSWMSIEGDATYKHSGDRSDTNYKRFTNANYDVNFNFGTERTIGFGQRYQRKGGNAITYNFEWRLNPLWKFSLYNSRERGHSENLKRGLREQEYTLTRDLHCWEAELSYNIKRGQGETIWLVFRLKAFPELQFEYNQAYHQPKPGSQSTR